MDSYDPRVHPDLRHPGRKMSLADLWSLLNKAFKTDSEGNMILNSKGVPIVKVEALPEDYDIKVATKEELDSEINLREAQYLANSERVSTLEQRQADFELKTDEVTKYFPPVFIAEGLPGHEDFMPDVVPAGDYMLQAHVADSTGAVTYK